MDMWAEARQQTSGTPAVLPSCTPPEPVEAWRTPATLADLVVELDLCRVPLDADPSRACLLLELSGTWASPKRVSAALRVRRQRAALADA
ncbi:hypothetical protein ACQP2P_01435 [Dactylosporangium sp. CA-139114]|uniref:hypothetical protein n=1 Tax=Dactylosporangium sp. CA-139114 TaxID=3239931 RepID=UPI003D973E6C